MGEGPDPPAGYSNSKIKTSSEFSFRVEAPISSVLFIAASVLSLTLIFLPQKNSIPVLAAYGWGDGPLFWQGDLWRLWVNSLLHTNIFHFLFNIYWVLRFSPVLETVLGSRRYLVYLLLAGWIVGLCGNLTWEEGGIGLSGLVYFMFAFLDWMRAESRAARRVCDDVTRWMFYAWLAVGPLVTLAGWFKLGNVVHLSGFLFGIMAAYWYRSLRERPFWSRVAPTAFLLTATLLPSTWYLHEPHLNPDWHYWKAYHAQNVIEQIWHYQKVLALAPDNNDARYNLGLAYFENGKLDRAEQAWLECASRDPQDDHVCRALFSLYAQKGDPEALELWARRLEKISHPL